MTLKKRYVKGASVALAALVLASSASCSPLATNAGRAIEQAGTESPAAQAPVVVSPFEGDWRVQGLDSEPLNTVDELAKESQVGVLGTVGDLFEAELRVLEAYDDGEYRPVILRIDGPKVVAGELADPEARSVYVTLPGLLSVEEYERFMPIGTEVVTYLNRVVASAGEGGLMEIVQGLPAEADVYTWAHPSGFAFAGGGGKEGSATQKAGNEVVFPFEHAVVENLTPEDIVPGAELPDFESISSEG